MILQKPIKGIFFDLGWTIFRPVNDQWFINSKVTKYIDMKLFDLLPKRRKDEAIVKAFQYLNENPLITTEDDEYQIFRTFYWIIADSLPELKLTRYATDEMAYCKVFDTSNYIFYDDAKSTLEKLRCSYKLGIISDTWPSAERILQSGGIDELFDVKIYSCYIGVSKPHAKIYQTALEKMELKASETVFIDDWEPNLNAAAEQGIQPVLIKTRPDVLQSKKYLMINTLSDLLTYIE